jgi:hypothetical protein
MADSPGATKAERFAEFLRRLEIAPAASTFDEAFGQLCDILNAVENELTSIPFDPANWQNDGRMYPPQLDNLRRATGAGDVRRFRSRAHNTLIGDNGAFELQGLSGQAIFSKPGADGCTVSSKGKST